jgi:anti-anti-sigma factor
MADKHGSHWLEREDFGPLTVVRFKMRQLRNDDHTRDVFDQVYSLVDDFGRALLVLNCDHVEYLASLALGKLVMLNRKVLIADGRLVLCSLTKRLRSILEKMRLTDLFHIYATEDEAAASFHLTS